MFWSKSGSRILRTATGLAIGVSAIVIGVKQADFLGLNGKLHCETKEKRSVSLPLNKVLASWTTNFTPSKEWDKNWDRRDPQYLVKPRKETTTDDEYNENVKKVTPTATRHLFFIRHGQYEMSPSEDKNRVLTKLGREQADFTGKRLAELGYEYDKVIHSTMTRATETAQIILKHLPNNQPVETTDCLCEGAPYPPEPPVGHWKPEYYQFYQDGARIEAAFRKYFYRASVKQEKDTYEVYVCHANVIRYFACRALQLPPEAWLRISLHNGSITWLSIRPNGRVALRGLGDAGFMPPTKLSTT